LIKFKNITSSERKIIQKYIDSNFGGGIFEKIKNNFQFIVGKKNEIFLVPPHLYKVLNKLSDSVVPFFLGLPIGSIAKNRFKINVSLLELISQYSNKVAIVTYKGEQTALYGYNIPKKQVKNIGIQGRKNDLVIIKNIEKETVALGKYLISTKKMDILNPNQIVIKVLLDLGWYIRKGN